MTLDQRDVAWAAEAVLGRASRKVAKLPKATLPALLADRTEEVLDLIFDRAAFLREGREAAPIAEQLAACPPAASGTELEFVAARAPRHARAEILDRAAR